MLLLLLQERATVYVEDATTGDYDVLVRSSLPCQRVNLIRRGDTVTIDRVELLGQRTLYYDPDFTMDDRAQVEIDGERWNVLANTNSEPVYRGGVAYRSCAIARAA